jgi:hypothetical protein
MARERRWDPCIAHRGEEVDNFIASYFGEADRKALLIGGAGFDPRSTSIAKQLSAAGELSRAILFQEIRPDPAQGLIDRAANNLRALTATVTENILIPVDIFGTDGAVVGGRNVVGLLTKQSFSGISDIVVDISALSVGTSFPIIRYLVELIERDNKQLNLHVFVTHDPILDSAIRSTSSDAPGFVHGFKGGSTLYGSASAAKLWLPQLATGRRSALGRLHEFVAPHDTCPILPFPASRPRLGDELAEEFLTELENGWLVDTRNIVYADEEDPLDLYRTILKLDDLRKPVFREFGGSLLILSPLGSKVMALGALMAALERDLPVAYLESLSYDLDGSVPATSTTPNLVHIWLEGDVYPQPRPKLYKEGTAAP